MSPAKGDDGREPQLAYSELKSDMLDEDGRRKKAAKIVTVLKHFLGRDDLDGLIALDIGCSTGFIADELNRAGAVGLVSTLMSPAWNAHANGSARRSVSSTRVATRSPCR